MNVLSINDYAWCFYLQYIQDQLNPFRDDVDEKYIGPDGMLTKYDNYRYVSAVVAATGLIKLSDGIGILLHWYCVLYDERIS